MKFVIIFYLFLKTVHLESSPASVSGLMSEKELECYSQEKIYHKPTDKCYKLLTTGPCKRGHLFVLEKPRQTGKGTTNPTIKTKCLREVCGNGEFYWPSTNSCVQSKDKNRLCGGSSSGEELYTNFFGEGECMCTRDPPRARPNADKTKKCYLLYSQGPCPPSQIFGYMRRSERASCLPDPCYSETLSRRQNKLLGKDAVLVAWDNGTCYELGTQGPCPEGFTFKVNPMTMEPNCASFMNQIFGGTKNCIRDENDTCQKKAIQRKRSTANKFMKELQSYLSN